MIPIRGVPIVVPIALAILWIGTTMLDRTRFGLHIYAVGGNPEAARRAGINVSRVRITCFILCSSLAVISGLFTASQVGTVESSAGRDIVLSGVAAAVVGGVSLFGGRGRLAQAAVGALLISMITNGLGLLGSLPASPWRSPARFWLLPPQLTRCQDGAPDPRHWREGRPEDARSRPRWSAGSSTVLHVVSHTSEEVGHV